MSEHQDQTFLEHLQELVKRLSRVGVLFAIGMGAGLVWYKQLSALLVRPLGEQLYFTSPIGGLNYMMYIGLAAGAVVALPVFIYQMVQFIRPVHRRLTTPLALRIMLASVVMAVLGIAYAYLISLPTALKFLMDMGGADVKPLITANEYTSFVTWYLVGSALIFQLPVVIFFIDRIRPIPPGWLKKAQRPVIAASFIIGAMLTPTPDPINQIIATLPMIALFEASALLVLLHRRRMNRLQTPQALPTTIERPVVGAQPLPQAAVDTSRSFMPVADTAPALTPRPATVRSGVKRSELSRTNQAHILDLSQAKVTHVVRRGPKRRYHIPQATTPIIDIRPA